MKAPEIIVRGKENGEGMIVRHRTSRGTEIFGLGMPNIYAHADWDLGPTWCYLIFGRKTTLIDTGRLGNFEVFISLLKSIGKKPSDVDRIIITHSHEDHDGNVAELMSAASAQLLAHELYQPMISYHADNNYGVPHPEFPGSCRLCRMPEQVYGGCLPYHERRSQLTVDIAVQDGQTLTDDAISFLFTPGHTPDSVCIVFEDEVIFTGDTVLPKITAQPTLAQIFKINNSILPEKYRQKNSVYGLMNFIKSLGKIAQLRVHPFGATFPAHRLFYNSKFNLLDSSRRAKEIVGFHVERCRNILEIMEGRPIRIEEIVVKLFPKPRLAGVGKSLAENEIRAHLEIMKDCGDIIWQPGSRDVIEPTGTSSCLNIIGSYS